MSEAPLPSPTPVPSVDLAVGGVDALYTRWRALLRESPSDELLLQKVGRALIERLKADEWPKAWTWNNDHLRAYFAAWAKRNGLML